jgi:two-component system OmpR family sensor kinase
MNSPIRNWSLRNRLTVGVLLLSAIGFIGAGLTSQFLLRSYLMSQVDEQLNSVIGGTTNRVNAAGIVNDEEVYPKRSEDDEHMPMRTRAAAPMTPLNRVPTSISVTVLDPFGNLIGGIGGDLNTNRIADYLKGLIPSQVASFGSSPFTVEAPGADFRVVTRVLPSALGSVVVAQSLGDFEKTANRIGRVFLFIGFIVLFLIGFAARQVGLGSSVVRAHPVRCCQCSLDPFVDR